VQRIVGPASNHAFGCTLDAGAFEIREHEFRQLFARGLRGAEQIDDRRARLLLDRASEADVRDVLAREARCCSFFDFEIAAAAHGVSVLVRVPEGSEAALEFLLGLASASTR
jgi:hypothetical protein